MSLGKVGRQLRRDLKANPKKAGALALLAGVAIWFWLPLVMGKRDDNASSVPELPASVAVAKPTATTPSAPVTPRQPWQALIASRKFNERTKTLDLAAAMPGGRNPFGASSAEIARRAEQERLAQTEQQEAEKRAAQAAQQQEAAAAVAKATPKAVSPQEAGLALSTTIVGDQLRIAMINGRGYAEGRMVSAAGMAYRLQRIGDKRVWLERDGQTFELAIVPRSAEKSEHQ